jgi:serine protease Do
LGEQAGALVADVFKGSPAEKAGLQRGDVVIEMAGKPVSDPSVLSRQIAMLRPGSTLDLRILRDGRARNVTVHVGEQRDTPRGLADEEDVGRSPDPPRDQTLANLGLALQTLSDPARRQLGLDRDVKGAVVSAVQQGGAADDSGLRVGDVILEVDRHVVDSASVAARAMAEAAPPILLLVKRGDSTVFLTLTPPG